MVSRRRLVASGLADNAETLHSRATIPTTKPTRDRNLPGPSSPTNTGQTMLGIEPRHKPRPRPIVRPKAGNTLGTVVRPKAGNKLGAVVRPKAGNTLGTVVRPKAGSRGSLRSGLGVSRGRLVRRWRDARVELRRLGRGRRFDAARAILPHALRTIRIVQRVG